MSTGCKYVLQPTGAESYVSMVYHLFQPVGLPTVIKDQAWYLAQLKEVMNLDTERSLSSHRSFYLFADE